MRTVAFTRPSERIPDSESWVREMGYRPLSAPSLDILPADEGSFRTFERKLAEGMYDHVIYTSPTAVEHAFSLSQDPGTLRENLARLSNIPIGPSTGRALSSRDIDAIAPPSVHSSQGILESYGAMMVGRRVAIVRSDKGTKVLVDGLRARQADVEEVITYRLSPSNDPEGVFRILEETESGNVDAMLFSSSMSVVSFFRNASERFTAEKVGDILSSTLVCAIGQPTKERLDEYGVSVGLVPDSADFRALLERLREMWEHPE